MICEADTFTEDGYCEFCGAFMEVPVDADGRRQEAFCASECRKAQARFDGAAEALFDRQD